MKDFYVFHVVSKGVPAIIGYASISRDQLVVCTARRVCMYRRNYRALSNRALERASLRTGFDTASRRKAVVAVTSPVRGAPPLAEGRERPPRRRTAPE